MGRQRTADDSSDEEDDDDDSQSREVCTSAMLPVQPFVVAPLHTASLPISLPTHAVVFCSYDPLFIEDGPLFLFQLLPELCDWLSALLAATPAVLIAAPFPWGLTRQGLLEGLT